jgi:hypothetical protein
LRTTIGPTDSLHAIWFITSSLSGNPSVAHLADKRQAREHHPDDKPPHTVPARDAGGSREKKSHEHTCR